jgi:hypothetical protein
MQIPGLNLFRLLHEADRIFCTKASPIQLQPRDTIIIPIACWTLSIVVQNKDREGGVEGINEGNEAEMKKE